MVPAPDNARDGARTLEQIYSLVERVRGEVLAEIDKLETKIDARMTGHDVRHAEEHKTHQVEHKSERERRTSLWLWAVTTILTAAGTLFAIVWALTHP